MWFIDAIQNLIYKIVNYYSPEERMSRELMKIFDEGGEYSNKEIQTQEESIKDLQTKLSEYTPPKDKIGMIVSGSKMCYNSIMKDEQRTEKYHYKNPKEAEVFLDKLANSMVNNLNKNVMDEQAQKRGEDYAIASVKALRRATLGDKDSKVN